jgi:hypothetical protein
LLVTVPPVLVATVRVGCERVTIAALPAGTGVPVPATPVPPAKPLAE